MLWMLKRLNNISYQMYMLMKNYEKNRKEKLEEGSQYFWEKRKINVS
jgi:hypothetical protein